MWMSVLGEVVSAVGSVEKEKHAVAVAKLALVEHFARVRLSLEG